MLPRGRRNSTGFGSNAGQLVLVGSPQPLAGGTWEVMNAAETATLTVLFPSVVTAKIARKTSACLYPHGVSCPWSIYCLWRPTRNKSRPKSQTAGDDRCILCVWCMVQHYFKRLA